MNNKINPALWFHTHNGKLNDVLSYYKNIFADDFKSNEVFTLDETPSGYTEMTNVEIFGVKYFFMSTIKKHHTFNDALSFMINCKDQEEIDKYWNYFSKEGQEVMCGWCIDKYGLRWQIIPENLDELMSKPNGHDVLMNQKKIIIKDY